MNVINAERNMWDMPLRNFHPHSQKRTETHSCDLIERQAAIDAIIEKFPFIDPMSIIWTISDLPSAQPTLYGYNIEHLVFIAKAMEKDGLSPEEVANLLRDTGYVVKFVIESLKEASKKLIILNK